MMCEWLASDDWSDVKLFCDGHTFNAHRAVLASVSSFLKNVLLSCSARDSPVCIILPDFNLDAMSSVLYYIYHGEVVIPQCSLDVFLDIIETMQIYVDPQYLSPTQGHIEKLPLDLKKYSVTLSKCNSSNRACTEKQQMFDLKRDTEFDISPNDGSLRNLDFREEQLHCSLSEKFSSKSPDLRLRCVNRQKSSTTRDLFIETYAQNGDSNGVTTGVLAISNERYHGRRSVLITNANSRHPSADDQLLESSAITSKFRSYLTPLSSNSVKNYYDSFYVPLKNDQSKEKKYEDIKKNKLNINFSADKMNILVEDIDGSSILNDSYLFEDNFSTLDLRTLPLRSKSIMYKIKKDKRNSENGNLQKNPKKQIIYRNETAIHDRTYLEVQYACSKDLIMNQVLRNPWCPQLPYYYKPFRRKSTVEDNSIKSRLELDNDKNNNKKVLAQPPNSNGCAEKNSKSEIRDATVTSHSLCRSVEDELKCTAGNKMLRNNESVKTHTRRHTAATRYSCGECCKSFSQLRNYKYHMSVHRGTKEFATTCPVCGKYFNDRGYLSSHMKIHRNRKEYKCSMCPKSFNQRVAYNMHVRIHTGVKPHVCEECGKAFSRKMLLKQHQRTHSGERPYACSYCDKRFADRSNMTLHLRLHTGVKPFKCSICPKSFTKKHHLKSHLNYHTGAKPYTCPKCKLAFTQSSNMRTHFKKCSAEETNPSSIGST